MKLLPPLLIALSLTLPATAVMAQANAAAAPASAASAAGVVVRPEVRDAIQAVIDLLKTQKTVEALARLDQTISTLPAQTPGEIGVLQRTRGLLALQAERYAEAALALQTALGTGTLSAADQTLMHEALVRATFQLKKYPESMEWLRRLAERGPLSPQMLALRVRALYLSGDYAATAKEIEARIAANPAAAPAEEDLRLLASSYGQIKDTAGYQRTLERLMRDHMRPEYWPDMLSRVPRATGWQPRWDLDLYRLRLQVGAMQEASDYVELAELASKAGLPVEAQQVLEAGYAKGLLGTGSGAAEHQKLRNTVTKLADDDRKNLATPPAKPPTIADGRSAATALSTGFALVTIGQADRGLELMKTAAGGTLLADPAYGRLQLALALQRAGRTPEALEGLRALAGHEQLGLLARLWVIALTPKKS